MKIDNLLKENPTVRFDRIVRSQMFGMEAGFLAGREYSEIFV
ncbi:MAG TPA: hypothetical protein O0X66_06545 [Methanocorpusculum sp.]|nr:hypothetical protein [Methanocorpusculum sp.]HJJ54139.1 hypothetical protein [Methanocorpusculum sp.]